MTNMPQQQSKQGHTPTPWTVYQCQFCKDDTNNESACGFNGSSLDASYDECHHTLSIEDARHIVHCVNNFPALVEALIKIRAAFLGPSDLIAPDVLIMIEEVLIQAKET